MAKKKVDSGGIDALGEAVRMQLGGFTVAEVQENFKGIRIDDFAERWFMDSNVILGARFYMIIGKYGSGKSGYVMRTGRRFMKNGGLFVYIETENKFTGGFVRAHLAELADSNRFVAIPLQTMDNADDPDDDGKTIKRTKSEAELDADALRRVGWLTKAPEVIKFIKNSENPDVPVLMAIDSVLGAPTKEAKRKFNEGDGEMVAQDTSHLRRASLLWKWLPIIMGELAGTNITLMGVNHAKEQLDLGGGRGRPSYMPPPESRWSGGAALSYYATNIVEFSQGGEFKTAETEGHTLYAKMRKGSSGTQERKIEIDFDYDFLYDESGEIVKDGSNNNIRIITWRWKHATMELLRKFFDPDFKPEKQRGPASYRNSMTLHCKGAGENKVYTFVAKNPDNPRDVLWKQEDLTLQDAVSFIETPEMQEFLQNFPKLHVMQHKEFDYLDHEPAEKEKP